MKISSTLSRLKCNKTDLETALKVLRISQSFSSTDQSELIELYESRLEIYNERIKFLETQKTEFDYKYL